MSTGAPVINVPKEPTENRASESSGMRPEKASATG